MSLPKHAIFIEPDGVLREFLLKLKASVRAWRTGQTYCNHPPHCTLIYGAYGNPESWLETLARQVQRKPFVLRVAGWRVFADDARAGGGQTVALAIEPSSALSVLQLDCATVLRAHHQPNSLPLCGEPLATSQRLYGFPFVGEHWLPHFTVASLALPRGHPLVEQMTRQLASFTQLVGHVDVWRIEGDEHTLIAKLPFATV